MVERAYETVNIGGSERAIAIGPDGHPTTVPIGGVDVSVEAVAMAELAPVIGINAGEIAYFENQTKSDFDFVEDDVSSWEISTGTPVWEAEQSVKISAPGGGAGDVFSSDGAGLPNYPVRGQEFRWFTRAVDTTGGEMMFGYDGGGTQGNYYRARLNVGDNQIALAFGPDLISGTIVDTEVGLVTGTWYENRLEWGDPTITYRVLDQLGDELASTSTDDTRRDGGGVGFSVLTISDSDGGTTAHDFAQILGQL